MKVWRYQVRERIEIDAPVENVFAVAADPQSVPHYAPEIERIELVESLGAHAVMVRSHLRISVLRFAFLYRYRYRRPVSYSGVQEGGFFLRGYFSFGFREAGGRTVVSHTEGILSRVPGLAHIAGLIYFRLLGRGGMREELSRLKRLVESGAAE